jgi:hypothetical protein
MKLVPLPNFERKVKKAPHDKLRRWHEHTMKFNLDERRKILETEMLQRMKSKEK